MVEGSWEFFLPTLQHILRAEGVTFDPVISEREGEREAEARVERLLAFGERGRRGVALDGDQHEDDGEGEQLEGDDEPGKDSAWWI